MCAGTSGLQLKIQDADDAELSNEVKNMIETVWGRAYDETK